MANAQESGGFFLPQSLPSPASSISSTISSLPHPRSHPLRAGSAKEEAARRYVEGKLLHISRRYAKKFQPREEGEQGGVTGYIRMDEPSGEMNELIDVLWLSGTPSLQIPYLLNIALTTTTYLQAFPPSPAPTFKLLRKLDHAFSSLLKGEDSISGEVLPGFEAGRGGLSKTDMVRLKSVVQDTRVLVVEVMSRKREQGVAEGDGDETDASMGGDGEWEDVDDEHDMDVATVYENTITALGEILENKTTYDAGA